MIWVYRILYLPLLLVSTPYYLYRMFRRGGYSKGFLHRFGLIGPIPPVRPGLKRIWLQAVSVGEVLAVGPILETLAQERKTEVVLTTTTSTGLKVARERYGDTTTAIGIFPLDFWIFSHAAWNRIKPDLAILMESELWPEHIRQAKRRAVAVMLINGRLSDRSYRRYKKMTLLSRWLTRSLDQVLASSSQDGNRFEELGVPKERIKVTGNLKFDVSVEPRLNLEQIAELKVELGFEPSGEPPTKPVILLGSSTWPGEEVLLVQTLLKALKTGIACRLLIVPRHAERRDQIEKILKRHQIAYYFRSKGKRAPGPVMIYVGDTTGELKILTQAADLVFIGKSLPPNSGGQTPIEAAALGKPLVFGPDMSNFRPICRSLLKKGAAYQVNDGTELETSILRLLNISQERDRMAKAAQKWHGKNQGAAKEVQQEIENRLKD